MSKPLKVVILVILAVLVTLAGIQMINSWREQRHMERYLAATAEYHFKEQRMTADEYLAMGVTEELYLEMYDTIMGEVIWILDRKPRLKEPGFIDPNAVPGAFGLERFRDKPAQALHVLRSGHMGVLEAIPRYYWLPFDSAKDFLLKNRSIVIFYSIILVIGLSVLGIVSVARKKMTQQ